MIEHVAVLQHDLAERRRGGAVAHGEAGVVADPARGEGAAAQGSGAVRRGAVQGQEVEGDGVARLELPAADVISSFQSSDKARRRFGL